jgi:ubiquinone/menaquinone biosynthesis C-methylase UbiE
VALQERNRLIHHYSRAALRDVAPLMRGRMIDIGCGEKPNQAIFAPYVEEHVGLDHEAGPHHKRNVDLVGTAYEIPAAGGSFDSALCTAVLEHLEDPAEALREAHRVLKPGAPAIYVTPLFWHLHEEPRDFYRYTSFGLRHLFETAGFDVEEIRPLAGFWVTWGQMLVYYLYHRARGRLGGLTAVAGLAIQALAGLLHRVDKPTPQWTWAYLVVARAGAGAEPRSG